MATESVQQIENELVEWCNQRIHPRVAITKETDLLGEGYLDSLLVMDLVAFVERRFAVAIDNAEISPRNFGSIQALAALAASTARG